MTTNVVLAEIAVKDAQNKNGKGRNEIQQRNGPLVKQGHTAVEGGGRVQYQASGHAGVLVKLKEYHGTDAEEIPSS